MSSVVQVLSLQAEELHARRREMADLRRQLADKELELSTAKSELNIFERRYQNVVGPMYAELDRVKAQILGLASKFYPKAENFREEAESAREQANEFQEKNRATENPTKNFNPPETLKKRLHEILGELEDLTLTEMFQLKQNIESAEREGHDLLQEIADDIEEKIKKAKTQIRDLAYDFIE